MIETRGMGFDDASPTVFGAPERRRPAFAERRLMREWLGAMRRRDQNPQKQYATALTGALPRACIAFSSSFRS